MKRLNKLATGAGILLFGGASLLSGCAQKGPVTLSNNPIARTIYEPMAKWGRPIWYESVEEQREREEGTKKTSPPENVTLKSDGLWYPEQGYVWANPNKKRDYGVRKLERYTLSFNEWIDKNGNEIVEHSELKGIKNIFKKNENFELRIYHETLKNVRGKNITLKIIDSKNNLVGKNIIINNHIKGYSMMNTLGNWSSGEYTAEWYSDNKLLNSHKFKVIDK